MDIKTTGKSNASQSCSSTSESVSDLNQHPEFHPQKAPSTHVSIRGAEGRNLTFVRNRPIIGTELKFEQFVLRHRAEVIIDGTADI
jgi:hypothetical protein